MSSRSNKTYNAEKAKKANRVDGQRKAPKISRETRRRRTRQAIFVAVALILIISWILSLVVN